MREKLSRRRFLQGAALAGTGVLLAACAPKVVKETVVVEKEVEKVVTATVAVRKLQQVTLQWSSRGKEGFDDKAYGWYFKETQKALKEVYPMLDFDPIQANYQREAMAMAAGNASDIAQINVPSGWPLMYRKQLASLTPGIDADPEWGESITHFVPNDDRKLHLQR